MKTYILTLLISISTFSLMAQNDDADYVRPHKTKSSSVRADFGKNIIAFSPVALVSDNNVGVALSYERLVNEYVGIRIPITTALNQPYINIAVEAKLYPTKNNNRPVKYAIAPCLMFGTGQNKNIYYTNQAGNTTSYLNRTHFGFLLNNSFNFTIMKNFYLGIDGGLGINYYDRTFSSQINAYQDNKLSLAGQLQMMIGVRF